MNVSPPSKQGELEVEVVDAELQQGLPVLGLPTTVFVLPLKAGRPHPAGCLGGLATQDRVGTVVVVGDPVAGLEHDLSTGPLDGLLELGSPAPSTLRNVRSWNGMANCARPPTRVRGPARHC